MAKQRENRCIALHTQAARFHDISPAVLMTSTDLKKVTKIINSHWTYEGQWCKFLVSMPVDGLTAC